MELIAALLHRPKVLFLDEPTIGLDVVSQKKVREFLRDYTMRNRITTLLTSHYMQDIEELCERVIIIDHGQVFFDGALQDIIDRLATHKIITLTRRKGLPEIDLARFGTVLEKNRQPGAVEDSARSHRGREPRSDFESRDRRFHGRGCADRGYRPRGLLLAAGRGADGGAKRPRPEGKSIVPCAGRARG